MHIRNLGGRATVAMTLAMAALGALAATSAAAQSASSPSEDLGSLSLEELVNIEVTSVSRKVERLAEASSAVYVITHDDIRRHGIRSIPEALRLAPGISVQQIDSTKWAVGSRGLSGRFANKLLVMIDGRTVYTPAFSGVFWDAQDTLVEDIDRIEVIRGPGATAWGANAVAGVINIITRNAAIDPGGSATLRVETDGSNQASLRHAGQIGLANVRMFVRSIGTDESTTTAGFDAGDDSRVTNVGLRADWVTSQNDKFGVNIGGYTGSSDQRQKLFSPLAPPYYVLAEDSADTSGGWVMGTWQRTYASDASTNVQLIGDFSKREQLQFSERRATIGAELQHQWAYGRNSFIAGLGYRHNNFDVRGSSSLAVGNTTPKDHVVSGFLQDDITLLPDRLRLTIGSKFEHNELSDKKLDVLPTVRLAWRITPQTTGWAAATRAIRTPSLGDLDLRLTDASDPIPPGMGPNPFPLPLRTEFVGTPDFQSEELLSWELGLRGQVSPVLGYELALFRMDYDKLRSFTVAGFACNPSGTNPMVDPSCLFTSDSVLTILPFTNGGGGSISGGEISIDWEVSSRWRVRSSYSVADEKISAPLTTTTSAPDQQFTLRGLGYLSPSLNVAAMLRYVGNMPDVNVDSYWQASANINWLPAPKWQISVGVRNLLHKRRLEYISELNDVVPTTVERSFHAQLRRTF